MRSSSDDEDPIDSLFFAIRKTGVPREGRLRLYHLVFLWLTEGVPEEATRLDFSVKVYDHMMNGTQYENLVKGETVLDTLSDQNNGFLAYEKHLYDFCISPLGRYSRLKNR